MLIEPKIGARKIAYNARMHEHKRSLRTTKKRLRSFKSGERLAKA